MDLLIGKVLAFKHFRCTIFIAHVTLPDCLAIYIRDQRKFEASPSITLKGRWMAALGFETGQKIEVITGPGQLIIRLAGEE